LRRERIDGCTAFAQQQPRPQSAAAEETAHHTRFNHNRFGAAGGYIDAQIASVITGMHVRLSARVRRQNQQALPIVNRCRWITDKANAVEVGRQRRMQRTLGTDRVRTRAGYGVAQATKDGSQSRLVAGDFQPNFGHAGPAASHSVEFNANCHPCILIYAALLGRHTIANTEYSVSGTFCCEWHSFSRAARPAVSCPLSPVPCPLSPVSC